MAHSIWPFSASDSSQSLCQNCCSSSMLSTSPPQGPYMVLLSARNNHPSTTHPEMGTWFSLSFCSDHCLFVTSTERSSLAALSKVYSPLSPVSFPALFFILTLVTTCTHSPSPREPTILVCPGDSWAKGLSVLKSKKFQEN